VARLVPDGASILFTAELPDHRAAVYMIHPDGSGLRRVLPDSVSLRCPSWAPDGHQFAVSAYRPGRSSIVAVAVESGAARTLLSSDTTFLDCPQWSPNGEAIALTIVSGGTAIWEVDPLEAWRSHLGILDLKSGQLRLLVDGPGLNNYGHWSRNGTGSCSRAIDMLLRKSIPVPCGSGSGAWRSTSFVPTGPTCGG